MNTNDSEQKSPSFWQWLKNIFSQRNVDSEKSVLAENVPTIIEDHPDSPLSGWKHYGILKYAEARIHKKLKDDEYDGRLIGLRVSYGKANMDNPQDDTLIDEHTMAYGYGIHNQEALNDEEDPLPDDFVLELYDEITALVRENAKISIGDFVVSLETTLNPSKMKNKLIQPRICQAGQCKKVPTQCVGKWRRMISTDGGATWRCTNHKPL